MHEAPTNLSVPHERQPILVLVNTYKGSTFLHRPKSCPDAFGFLIQQISCTILGLMWFLHLGDRACRLQTCCATLFSYNHSNDYVFRLMMS